MVLGYTDADLASNTQGWQGPVYDSPYFRIFNPITHEVRVRGEYAADSIA